MTIKAIYAKETGKIIKAKIECEGKRLADLKSMKNPSLDVEFMIEKKKAELDILEDVLASLNGNHACLRVDV